MLKANFKALGTRGIDMKRYDLKTSYEFYLELYQETGNSNYFDRAQAIKRQIDQFKRMDVFIARADRLNGVV